MPEPVAATPAEPKAVPNVDTIIDAALGQDATAPAAAPDTPPSLPAPSWRDTVLDGDDVPENFRGKKAGDLFASWQSGQETVRRYQSERDRAIADSQRANTQLTAQQAAQQAVREMLTPKELPKEDPRYAQLNDLMFTDPNGYRELYDQLQDEKLQRTLAVEREKIKRETAEEATSARNRDVGRWAFGEAKRSLNGRGVPDSLLTPQRIAALYSAITLKSTPESPNEYYDQGGPQNPGVIFKAWGDLFGFPAAQTDAPPLAAAAAPPPVVTPPGGGKPAAAVQPPPQAAAKPMSRELSAVMESLAEEAGRPKDKLIKRAQQRGAA